MVVSVLDGVPGLGDTRRKALLRKFGSLKRLRTATVDEIAEIPGIGPARPPRSWQRCGSSRPRAPRSTPRPARSSTTRTLDRPHRDDGGPPPTAQNTQE